MITMIYFRNEKRYDFIPILIVTIIFLISFCSISFSSTLKRDFPAPTFTLETIEEETLNLKDFKEKQALLVLYFYSHDSQDSLRGIGEVNDYFKNHITKEKYEIILVNVQEDLQEEDIASIKNYLDYNEIIFPILLDEQNEVSRLYNVEKLPTAIFLDKNLFVKRVYPGFTASQQTLIFQYVSYLLDSSEINVSKKEKKDKKLVGDEEPPDCCSAKSLNL